MEQHVQLLPIAFDQEMIHIVPQMANRHGIIAVLLEWGNGNTKSNNRGV